MTHTVVVGLLRAVNVGGRTLTSARLRAVAEGLGYLGVRTYVNSGNVVVAVPGQVGDERLAWRGTELYVHYVHGIGRSRLTLPVLERTAGRTGTARNWNSVRKLDALALEVAAQVG